MVRGRIIIAINAVIPLLDGIFLFKQNFVFFNTKVYPPMTWQQLAEAFEIRIAHIVPINKTREQRGFSLLETYFKERMPQALENPLLLLEIDKVALYISIQHEKYSNDMNQAFKRILETLKYSDAPDKLVAGITAEQQVFTKADVAFCAAKWLEQQGWQTIGAVQTAADIHGHITAVKSDINLTGAAVGSPGNEALKKAKDSYPAINYFKERMGRVILALMEEINADPKITTAVFIADDLLTRQLTMQYASHIKKLGIKVYMVKSVMQVEEV